MLQRIGERHGYRRAASIIGNNDFDIKLRRVSDTGSRRCFPFAAVLDFLVNDRPRNGFCDQLCAVTYCRNSYIPSIDMKLVTIGLDKDAHRAVQPVGVHVGGNGQKIVAGGKGKCYLVIACGLSIYSGQNRIACKIVCMIAFEHPCRWMNAERPQYSFGFIAGYT